MQTTADPAKTDAATRLRARMADMGGDLDSRGVLVCQMMPKGIEVITGFLEGIRDAVRLKDHMKDVTRSKPVMIAK